MFIMNKMKKQSAKLIEKIKWEKHIINAGSSTRAQKLFFKSSITHHISIFSNFYKFRFLFFARLTVRAPW